MEFASKYKSLIFILLTHLFVMSEFAYSQPLLIAVEDDAAPWSQKNGTGYANDIVLAAFKAVEVDVKLLVVPYSRAKEMVINGKVPACFSMSWLPEFENKIIFPKTPLFTVSVDYFTGLKKSLNIKKEADLAKGTVVGTVFGYEYPPSTYKLRDKGIIVFEESESEEINLKKVAFGRIDYALIVHNKTKPAELLIARADATNKIKKAFPCGEQGSYIGFSIKHPQGLEALKKFNRGMAIISKNGTLKKIELKWEKSAISETNKLTKK